jgi:alpha-1,2-rhamnosyltransferase
LECIEFEAGDVLILPEIYLDDSAWHAIESAKRSGATIVAVVYDLIPIKHSSLVPPEHAVSFRQYIQNVYRNADGIMAISETVRRDIEDYLRDAAGVNPTLRGVDRFRLGCGVDMASPAGEVRDALRTAFANDGAGKTFLTVCSIEPRKNYGCLLDAFDRVWSQCPEARLVIVGRPGPVSFDVKERIRRHKLLNKRLFWFADLSDTEVKFCYARSDAFIFASLAEGFGLPIVEALQHGLPAIVSDIPVHREVGREFCIYFDPMRPEDLANVVFSIESKAIEFVRPAVDLQLPTWDESAQELLEKSLQFTRIPRRPCVSLRST